MGRRHAGAVPMLREQVRAELRELQAAGVTLRRRNATSGLGTRSTSGALGAGTPPSWENPGRDGLDRGSRVNQPNARRTGAEPGRIPQPSSMKVVCAEKHTAGRDMP